MKKEKHYEAPCAEIIEIEKTCVLCDSGGRGLDGGTERMEMRNIYMSF